MRTTSSLPIVLAFLAVCVGAFAWDARNSQASASAPVRGSATSGAVATK